MSDASNPAATNDDDADWSLRAAVMMEYATRRARIVGEATTSPLNENQKSRLAALDAELDAVLPDCSGCKSGAGGAVRPNPLRIVANGLLFLTFALTFALCLLLQTESSRRADLTWRHIGRPFLLGEIEFGEPLEAVCYSSADREYFLNLALQRAPLSGNGGRDWLAIARAYALNSRKTQSAAAYQLCIDMIEDPLIRAVAQVEKQDVEGVAKDLTPEIAAIGAAMSHIMPPAMPVVPQAPAQPAVHIGGTARYVSFHNVPLGAQQNKRPAPPTDAILIAEQCLLRFAARGIGLETFPCSVPLLMSSRCAAPAPAPPAEAAPGPAK